MKFKRAIAVSILFFGSLAASRECLAGDAGLDVVLAIDTSGSMRKTDPDNLRIEACKLFLSLLEAGNRVGLVTFDTFPETMSPMTSLGANREAWVGRLERVTSDGAYTDLYKAVHHAYEVLRASSRTRRAVVLMTDGRMDVGNPVSERELTAHLLDTLIPDMRSEGIQIYAVAFTKESDFDFLKRVALGSDGFFYLAEKDTDLHVTFTNIYDRLIGPDTIPVEGDEFYVDRSVREITVVVTKSDPETDVLLVDPDRKEGTVREHSPEVQWFQSQAFEMITVSKPLPGPWRIRYGAEQGNKVFILTDLRLLTGFSDSVVPVETARAIEVWLQQGPDAEERRPLSIQEMRVVGEVQDAGGVGSALRFFDDGTKGDAKAGDGVFTGLLKTTRPGRYRLRVTAHGLTFERQREHDFYVPEKEFVPPGDAGTAEVRSVEASSAQGAREDDETASGTDGTKDTSWGAVFVKFSLINLLFVVVGTVVVLQRKGSLKLRKKAHEG